MTKRTCETCRLWCKKFSKGDEYNTGGMCEGNTLVREHSGGECRAHPPVVVGCGVEGPVDAGWPYTSGHHWCGEHLPEDTVTATEPAEAS